MLPSGGNLLKILGTIFLYQRLLQLSTATHSRGFCFVAAAPFTSDVSASYNGTTSYLAATAWHARALTNISWNLPADVATSPRDRILVYWDEVATDVVRFGSPPSAISGGIATAISSSNRSSRSSNSSNSNSSSSPSYDNTVLFPDTLGPGSDVCGHETYLSGSSASTPKQNAFYSPELSRNATVELGDSGETWWYTSTLGQQDVDPEGSSSSSGTALVLLSDPGVYIVCLVLGNASCVAADCLELVVYQAPYDYMEVDSTNIGALVTVRFNVVSRDASEGDWGWILGGVDPTFSVEDANALTSGEVYTRFKEGCWFYFGKAVLLGEPFLCSRDPDTELASLQASTADRQYQYGWLKLYSSAVGMVSLWYAMDEDYSFSMIHNFYTCGIDVQPPATLTTPTTQDVVIVGVLEDGPGCLVGDGIPLKIRTTEVTFQYVHVQSSIFFLGQMDSMTSSETSLSVRLPVKGTHEIVVRLVLVPHMSWRAENNRILHNVIMGDTFLLLAAGRIDGGLHLDYALSSQNSLNVRSMAPVQNYTDQKQIELETGALLTTLNIDALAAEPYAPASVVHDKPPGLAATHSSFNVTFASRDFYSNIISIGYGDDAFSAWIYPSGSTGEKSTFIVPGVVRDIGDGSYIVETQPYDTPGTALLFVQRHGYNIPGSPFETYVFGPDQCVIESLDIVVGGCNNRLYRKVVHQWKEGVDCEGGLALPEDARVACSYIPAQSVLGRSIVVSSVAAIIYAAAFLIWIQKHRKYVVVKLGQPFVCKLFLLGCGLLNVAGMLRLGEPRDALCIALPWLTHTAITFTSGCLYMKTYRVHRLFNNHSLSRISIKDRNLVIWVLRLVCFDLLVLGMWMLVDRPGTAIVRNVEGYTEVYSPVCDLGAAYFNSILWVYKGCLNLFGVVMAAKTWNCADGVGESHSICLSVYNTTLLGAINVAVHLLVPDNQVATNCGQSFAGLCGTVLTITILFGPKAYRLYFRGDIKSGGGGSGKSTHNSMSKSINKSVIGLSTTAPSSVRQSWSSTLAPRHSQQQQPPVGVGSGGAREGWGRQGAAGGGGPRGSVGGGGEGRGAAQGGAGESLQAISSRYLSARRGGNLVSPFGGWGGGAVLPVEEGPGSRALGAGGVLPQTTQRPGISPLTLARGSLPPLAPLVSMPNLWPE